MRACVCVYMYVCVRMGCVCVCACVCVCVGGCPSVCLSVCPSVSQSCLLSITEKQFWTDVGHMCVTDTTWNLENLESSQCRDNDSGRSRDNPTVGEVSVGEVDNPTVGEVEIIRQWETDTRSARVKNQASPQSLFCFISQQHRPPHCHVTHTMQRILLLLLLLSKVGLLLLLLLLHLDAEITSNV